MRLGQFQQSANVEPWCGVIDGETVINVPEAGQLTGIDLPVATRDILHEHQWKEKVNIAVDAAKSADKAIYNLDALKQTAPITRPEKIVCVGLNYEDHAEEADMEVPEEPVLFSKFPTAVIGPEKKIVWDPEVTEEVDYEAELVVVIGKEGRNLSADKAADHIAGYTVGNDVSARDLQFADEQWVRGKSLNTFAPLGPSLATPDEIGNPNNLDIWAEINGTRQQDSTTDNLFFSVESLVSFCSQMFTLAPGDIIFTGTPAGVGIFRDPPLHLEEGDTVTVGIENIGELSNKCAYSGD